MNNNEFILKNTYDVLNFISDFLIIEMEHPADYQLIKEVSQNESIIKHFDLIKVWSVEQTLISITGTLNNLSIKGMNSCKLEFTYKNKNYSLKLLLDKREIEVSSMLEFQ